MMMAALRSLLLAMMSMLLISSSSAAFVPGGRNSHPAAPGWSSRTTSITNTGDRNTASTSTIALFGVQDREKMLREEIEQRNTLVENEKQYAVADGELLEQLDSEETPTMMIPNKQLVASTATAVLVAAKEEQGNDDETVATATATLQRPAEVAKASSSISVDKNGLAARMERLTKPRAYPLFLAEKAAEIMEAAVHDMTTMFDSKSSSSSLLKQEDTNVSSKQKKERIVILGTGWGAASFLKTIDTDIYAVTVVR
jgi:hypothetical protein